VGCHSSLERGEEKKKKKKKKLNQPLPDGSEGGK